MRENNINQPDHLVIVILMPSEYQTLSGIFHQDIVFIKCIPRLSFLFTKIPEADSRE